MVDPQNQSLLDVVVQSWERHNTVLLNLLHALPEGGLSARAMPDSPSVSQMLTHIHHERMVSVLEEAPEYAGTVPSEEWRTEEDPELLTEMLNESARVVRAAVEGRVREGKDLDRNFGHPVFLIQFLIFHESYHHGQIKLALKAEGRPLADEVAGLTTWDVWRRKEG